MGFGTRIHAHTEGPMQQTSQRLSKVDYSNNTHTHTLHKQQFAQWIVMMSDSDLSASCDPVLQIQQHTFQNYSHMQTHAVYFPGVCDLVKQDYTILFLCFMCVGESREEVRVLPNTDFSIIHSFYNTLIPYYCESS